MFKGSITALVTPFKGENIDRLAYEKFIEFQILNGTNGIVPCGTTGESPTISHSEHKELIQIAINSSGGRIPVIAGTGSNSTEEAVEMTKFAEKVKADAALVVTPYYNTMARLYELKNIIGVKDATGDLGRVTLQKNKMGNDFLMLSGNDENTYEFNKLGGSGCISVSANVAPKMCSDFHKLCNSNSYDEAKKIFDKLLPLHDIMFVESNPVPAKYSLSLMEMMSEHVRLPLVTAENSSKEKIKKVLKNLSLI